MLSTSTQFRSIQHSAYFTPKKVAFVSFGSQSKPLTETATPKAIAARVFMCILASGVGHYIAGGWAHELAEHLTLLPHSLGHIISDSAVCCDIPTGFFETVIEKRPEKGFKKRGVGFFKSLGKNTAKNFALSTSGHIALGVPADMAADGLQAAINAGPKIATAISEAALCCGVPSTILEIGSTWYAKRKRKKAALITEQEPAKILA